MRWRGPRSHPWAMSTNTVKPEALIHEPEHRAGPYHTALCRFFRGRVVTGVIASAILAAGGGAGIPRYLAELPARSSSSCSPGRGGPQPAAGQGGHAMLLTRDCGCQLSRVVTPALATVVVLTALGLGLICWVINSPERSDRVNRMMFARRGDGRCFEQGTSARRQPASRPRSVK
jgi:hypothetical protein